jgi:hypothetical protein
LLCVVGGREPVEGAVEPVGIVLGAPVTDEDLGFEEAANCSMASSSLRILLP